MQQNEKLVHQIFNRDGFGRPNLSNTMTIITQEHLFQWNMEQVLKRIEHDYSKQIMAAYDSNRYCQTFEDWLNMNPEILGRYVCEQLSENFDFEKEAEL